MRGDSPAGVRAWPRFLARAVWPEQLGEDATTRGLQAVLGKNGLGLLSLAYAPRALPGWVGGLDGLWMAYDMSLHTFERLSCSHDSTRTHRRKHC